MTAKKPPPLLGYNTNVRHCGILFHIQTEDSGIDHPHIITHLFIEGTILATKKSSYAEVLNKARWDEKVRQMMKDQHRSMFIELRDGNFDSVAAVIFDASQEGGKASEEEFDVILDQDTPVPPKRTPIVEIDKKGGVRVIRPAVMTEKKPRKTEEKQRSTAQFRGRSIFDTPSDNGEFGENLITDKSLDEVILSYLTDELEE